MFCKLGKIQSKLTESPSSTSINFDPHGEIEDFNGDNEDHDENEDTIEMNENKEALITERIFWNEGDFRKKNFSMEQAK